MPRGLYLLSTEYWICMQTNLVSISCGEVNASARRHCSNASRSRPIAWSDLAIEAYTRGCAIQCEMCLVGVQRFLILIQIGLYVSQPD